LTVVLVWPIASSWVAADGGGEILGERGECVELGRGLGLKQQVGSLDDDAHAKRQDSEHVVLEERVESIR
jgi:hypothetical protein